MSQPPVEPGKGAVQVPKFVHGEIDALPTGTRLAEFEILRVLGMGGFGIVYLALDTQLQRHVAVKEYLPAMMAGRGEDGQVSVRSRVYADTFSVGLRSFVNEARLLARFDNASLVKVHRFWEANGTAYMVMPYYEGATLKQVRQSMTAQPDEAWLRRVLDNLLGALEVLHAASVFHRDVAPDNILLLRNGQPVLLDFGAARHVMLGQTQTLTAMLKPAYAPIEQYAEATEFRQGPWTDIYATAATLHYLLTGRAPPTAAARAVHDNYQPLRLRDELARPSEGKPCDPRWLAALDWALEVKPQARPQSVGQWRDALAGRTAVPSTLSLPQADPDATIRTTVEPMHADFTALAAPVSAPFPETLVMRREDRGRFNAAKAAARAEPEPEPEPAAVANAAIDTRSNLRRNLPWLMWLFAVIAVAAAGVSFTRSRNAATPAIDPAAMAAASAASVASAASAASGASAGSSQAAAASEASAAASVALAASTPAADARSASDVTNVGTATSLIPEVPDAVSRASPVGASSAAVAPSTSSASDVPPPAPSASSLSQTPTPTLDAAPSASDPSTAAAASPASSAASAVASRRDRARRVAAASSGSGNASASGNGAANESAPARSTSQPAERTGRQATAEGGPTSPEGVCAGRYLFSLWNCMRETCNRTRWQTHPQCIDWHRMEQRNSRNYR